MNDKEFIALLDLDLATKNKLINKTLCDTCMDILDILKYKNNMSIGDIKDYIDDK